MPKFVALKKNFYAFKDNDGVIHQHDALSDVTTKSQIEKIENEGREQLERLYENAYKLSGGHPAGAVEIPLVWTKGSKFDYDKVVSEYKYCHTQLIEMPIGGITYTTLVSNTRKTFAMANTNVKFFHKEPDGSYTPATDYEACLYGKQDNENLYFIGYGGCYFPYADNLYFCVNARYDNAAGWGDYDLLDNIHVFADSPVNGNVTSLPNIFPVYVNGNQSASALYYHRGYESVGGTQPMAFHMAYTFGSFLPLDKVRRIECDHRFQLSASIIKKTKNSFQVDRVIFARPHTTTINSTEDSVINGTRLIDLTNDDSDGYILLTITPARHFDPTGASGKAAYVHDDPFDFNYDKVLNGVSVVWKHDTIVTRITDGSDNIAVGNLHALERFKYPMTGNTYYTREREKDEEGNAGEYYSNSIGICPSNDHSGILYNVAYTSNVVGYNIPFSVYAAAAQNPHSRYYKPAKEDTFAYGIQCSNYTALLLGLEAPEKSQYAHHWDTDTPFLDADLELVNDIGSLQAGDILCRPNRPDDRNGHVRIVTDKVFIDGKLYCVNIAEAWPPITQRQTILVDNYNTEFGFNIKNSDNYLTMTPVLDTNREQYFKLAMRYDDTEKHKLVFPDSVSVNGKCMCDRGTGALYTETCEHIYITTKTNDKFYLYTNDQLVESYVASEKIDSAWWSTDIRSSVNQNGRYSIRNSQGTELEYFYYLAGEENVVWSADGLTCTFNDNNWQNVKYAVVHYRLLDDSFVTTHTFRKPFTSASFTFPKLDMSFFKSESRVAVIAVSIIMAHESGCTYTVQNGSKARYVDTKQ